MPRDDGAAPPPRIADRKQTRERSGRALALRRVAFASLVAASFVALTAGFAFTVAADGAISALDLAMLALFAATLPWISIGFWCGAVGFALLRDRSRVVQRVVPLRGLEDDAPITLKVALATPIHEEDPDLVFRNLRATLASLDAAGSGDRFTVFVLSDTRNDAVAVREQALFETARAADPRPERWIYRRRAVNDGYKAGNLRDFCERWGDGFDAMIVLDADSVMSGRAVLRLVRAMQANPRLGVLQHLVVGAPQESPFGRVFQFGMRFGMRTHTVGAAWWQGDAGPYWGHNAILRVQPFRAHCGLPELPGGPPLGGPILSHDQVEAALMRAAGWEVRALPIEDGSYEANPPTLPEFIRRDLRWCRGNLQYLALIGWPQFRPLGRVQLLLAILMYAGAPAWIGLLLGVIAAAAGGHGPTLIATPGVAAAFDGAAGAAAAALYFAVMTMAFAPKLSGVLDALLDRGERARFGGAGALLAGAAVETAFSLLLFPVMVAAQALAIAGFALGRAGPGWAAQGRMQRAVGWGEATRALWPQTALGLTAAAALAASAPDLLPWAAPALAGLCVAIPFAVWTARPRLGRWMVRRRLCSTPEELAPVPPLRDLTSPREASAPPMRSPVVEGSP